MGEVLPRGTAPRGNTSPGDLGIRKDFANYKVYKDEALEIYPTIVYACTAVF